MSLFRRVDRSPAPRVEPPRRDPVAAAPPPPPERRRPPATSIGPGLVVRGLIAGRGRVEILGTFEGEVQVDGTVVVGPGGRVVGTVVGRDVRIEGRLEGAVQASERAEVAATGSVEADLEAPRVVIGEGAFFKGNVKMGGERGAGAGAAVVARERP